MTRPTPPPEGTRSSAPAEKTTVNAAADGPASRLKQFFEEQHRRLSPGLRRFFLERAAGRQELAEELSQKCWGLAWQALIAGKYDSARAAYSTFVYAIAQNVWLQYLRSAGQKQNTNAALQDDFGSGSVGFAPEETAKTIELVDLLRAVLRGEHDAQLSEEERWIVRAVADGETDRGLAAKLKLSPSTANARKNAAFDKLRRFLATRGHRDEDERAPGV
jgi:DNA-directed RNA polymerase specialized sigma24 family protein